MQHALPPYTPSPPSPEYSDGLLPGEQTVAFAHGAPSRPPTAVYRRITDHLTVILRNHQPGSVCPVYGRSGVIQGDVMLRNLRDLTSVTLKLEGNFVLHASGIPVSNTFLSMTHVLWSASDAQHCPQTIPFAIDLPPTFDDGGQVRALPPTFESAEPRAVCSYLLTIDLSRPRNFLSFLKGNDAVEVPFVYRPRSRPHLPILPRNLSFMSTVKSSPEEWHEVICTLPMSRGSGLTHAECLLFIPSVQTYSFSDTIPFHLQIRGNPASLIPFLEQDRDPYQGAATGQWNGGIIIRVYILRHISARIHGQSVTACRNIGEGKLEPSQSLPLDRQTFLRHPLGNDLDSLDWDGVLRCGREVDVPSFFTNQFSVKDSIVLSITPRQPLKSPVLGATHSFPIRLVTDPWSNHNNLIHEA